MITKRARVEPPTVQHVMHYGRLLMEKDPFKHRAPREEGRNFRALFGCSPEVVLVLWLKLEGEDLLPEEGTMTHLLWTFMHCKQYSKWKTMNQTTGTDPKTLRKWIKVFLDAVELLESSVVSAIAGLVCSNKMKADICYIIV